MLLITVGFLFVYLKTELDLLKCRCMDKNPSSGISLSPFHPAQRGIPICQSFLHNIIQNRAVLLRQFFIPDLKLRTRKGSEHIQIGTRHSHRPFLYFRNIIQISASAIYMEKECGMLSAVTFCGHFPVII